MTNTNTNIIKPSLPISIIDPGKQLYTLLVKDRETKQQTVAQYYSSAILTTDLEELVIYTSKLINWYGKQYVYSISMVTEVDIGITNQIMLDKLEELKEKKTSAYVATP